MDIANTTPKTLVNHLRINMSTKSFDDKVKAQKATMIHGAPGVGKTAMIQQLATERNCRLVSMHLPQYDPTDIKGIAVRNEDGTVSWIASSQLPQQHVVYSNTVSEELNWQFCEHIAVYAFKNNKLIAQHNDTDFGTTGSINVNWSRVTSDTIKVDVECNNADKIIVVDKAVMFLDELSSAEPATQNTALQLVLEGAVGEYVLPMNTPIVAAGNRECDGAFVQPLSHPLMNRFQHFTLVAHPQDLVDWGIQNDMRPEVLGFIKAYPNVVTNYNPDALVDGNYGFSTPRSLKSLSDQYMPIEYFNQVFGEEKGSEQRFIYNAGIIGGADASLFNNYLETYMDLPSIEDILKGEAEPIDVEPSKSFGLLFSIIQHIYVKHADLKENTTDENEQTFVEEIDTLIGYIKENFNNESLSWMCNSLIMGDNQVKSSLLRKSDNFMSVAKDSLAFAQYI